MSQKISLSDHIWTLTASETGLSQNVGHVSILVELRIIFIGSTQKLAGAEKQTLPLRLAFVMKSR
jgi:hypothetical protein